VRTALAALITVLFALPLPADAQSRQKPADPAFGVDKVKHFFIVGFVESMSFASLQAAGSNRSTARTGAIAAATAVSFGREIHDRRTKGLFSVRDLVWDAIGASAALIVINKTQK
jgi:uncharacterized protein YfiM (DUF2279 family)